MEQLNLLGFFETNPQKEREISWNLWHGCHKISAGCQNCYMFRTDALYGRNSNHCEKTASFDLPLRRNQQGHFLLRPGTQVNTCFTSDFLLPDADPWREEAWSMIRQRPDLRFFFITKRIHRLDACLPSDWGNGWDHVCIGCTVENQETAAFRLPLFRSAPIRHKIIVCEPLLEPLDLRPWLGPWAQKLIAGGESGKNVRPCHFDWVLDLRQQCVDADLNFTFRQTGAYFVKDHVQYHIPRKYQHLQAKKAAIDYYREDTP